MEAGKEIIWWSCVNYHLNMSLINLSTLHTHFKYVLTNFVTLMCICGTFLSGIDWDIRLWSEAGWNIVVTLLGINIKDFGSFRAMIVTNHCGISPTVYKKKAFQRKRHLICCNIYDYCSCSTLCLVGKWVRSLFDVVYLFTSRPSGSIQVFK